MCVCVCAGHWAHGASQDRPSDPPSWMLSSHLTEEWWFANWPQTPPQGEERPKREADHSRLEGGSVSKQGNLSMRLVLGRGAVRESTRQEISASARQNLQSSHGGLNEVHSHILSRWVQPHHTLSGCGNGGRDRQSKDRRGGQEPVIAWVQLKHQLVITSSQ